MTTLNFNLLFEIGFVIGLGLPLLLIRDTSFMRSQREFEELRVLQTIGYIDFQNTDMLTTRVATATSNARPLSPIDEPIRGDQPLYIMRDPVGTDGTIAMMAAIKKSGVNFRTYDPDERRLTLPDARRQVARSLGVIAHLISRERKGAMVHNALCAFVCGMAMAQQKVVVMIQEGDEPQPIDYRDVVLHYRSASQIRSLLDAPLHAVVRQLQERFRALRSVDKQESLLHKLDLGDVAAENEVRALDAYYVPSGQYSLARQGRARLIIGRKGTGKTALFYEIRRPLMAPKDTLVLDLRPEGHQFMKLKEALKDFTPGLAQHTMVAFWNYILLAEFARALVFEENYARRDPSRFERWKHVSKVYEGHDPGYEADFSERLLLQIDRICNEFGRLAGEVGAKLTEIIYKGDIRELNEAVGDYLAEKQAVWLLVDNLDKGWPTHGTSEHDIMVVIGLLDATRKLQRQMEDRGIDFRCLIFLRTDIYEHLRRAIPDKGKETPIILDGEDRELFRQILQRRIEASTEISAPFDQVWPRLCTTHVGTHSSFDYIVSRTLMRPRDLLSFVREAIEVAVNRGHEIVGEDDIRLAERSYSEDLLLVTSDEINDTHPGGGDVLYAFQGRSALLSLSELYEILLATGVPKEERSKMRDLLLWFSFIGVAAPNFEQDTYSYSVRFNIRHLMQAIDSGEGLFVVHPAFRAALNIRD